MENQHNDQKEANRFKKTADAPQIADSIVLTWREIYAALSPIIGQRGVTALYKRSLHLASRTHHWLSSAPESTAASIDFAALKSVLAQQSDADAAAGGDAHLKTFQELLAALIGESLTQRLLSSVWEKSSDSGTFKQDHPS